MDAKTEARESRTKTTTAAERMLDAIEEIKDSLGYLARNMTAAFKGNLTSIEANAHAALVAALGHLTTLEELQAHVALDEERLEELQRRNVS